MMVEKEIKRSESGSVGRVVRERRETRNGIRSITYVEVYKAERKLCDRGIVGHVEWYKRR